MFFPAMNSEDERCYRPVFKVERNTTDPSNHYRTTGYRFAATNDTCIPNDPCLLRSAKALSRFIRLHFTRYIASDYDEFYWFIKQGDIAPDLLKVRLLNDFYRQVIDEQTIDEVVYFNNPEMITDIAKELATEIQALIGEN